MSLCLTRSVLHIFYEHYHIKCFLSTMNLVWNRVKDVQKRCVKVFYFLKLQVCAYNVLGLPICVSLSLLANFKPLWSTYSVHMWHVYSLGQVLQDDNNVDHTLTVYLESGLTHGANFVYISSSPEFTWLLNFRGRLKGIADYMYYQWYYIYSEKTLVWLLKRHFILC